MKLMPSQPIFLREFHAAPTRVELHSSKAQHPRIHFENQNISCNSGVKLNSGKSVRFSGLEGFSGFLAGAAFNTAKDAVCKVGSAGIVGGGILLEIFTGTGGTALGAALGGADAGLAHLFHESCTKFMKKVRLT